MKALNTGKGCSLMRPHVLPGESPRSNPAPGSAVQGARKAIGKEEEWTS